MESFLSYLHKIKRTLAGHIPPGTTFHVVLGNESCDLDSAACTVALAYLLANIYQSKKEIIVIPILNVSKEEFPLRTEVSYVFSELKIADECLIFWEDVNLLEIKRNHNLYVHIVDHHVLPEKYKFLIENVIQIIDHRPRDQKGMSLYNKDITINIKDVGSCATLIAEEMYGSLKECLFKELATLLYYTIIYDTVGLVPKNGRTTELDVCLSETLQEDFCLKEDKKHIFERLWSAHCDVSHLTPAQILIRDLKIVFDIPIPGLPFLVENFLKLTNALQAVESLLSTHNATVAVLIGLEANGDVKRDIAIYCQDDNNKLVQTILDKFKNDPRAIELDLIPSATSYPNLIHFQQRNIKKTRKHIIPIIIDAVTSIN